MSFFDFKVSLVVFRCQRRSNGDGLVLLFLDYFLLQDMFLLQILSIRQGWYYSRDWRDVEGVFYYCKYIIYLFVIGLVFMFVVRILKYQLGFIGGVQ